MTVPSHLTRRERLVYKVLHGVGVAIAVTGFIYFFILDTPEPTYIETTLFALAVCLVPVFGYALQSDTRVIYSIPWLLNDDGEGS